jgi:hypothetical protein
MQWLHRSDRQAGGHDQPQMDRGNASRRPVWLAVFGVYGQARTSRAVAREVLPCEIGHTGRQGDDEQLNGTRRASSVPPPASGWSTRTSWPRTVATYFVPVLCFTTKAVADPSSRRDSSGAPRGPAGLVLADWSLRPVHLIVQDHRAVAVMTGLAYVRMAAS